MSPVAEKLFDYLHDMIYNPSHAGSDVTKLPKPFKISAAGQRAILFYDGGAFRKEIILRFFHQ